MSRYLIVSESKKGYHFSACNIRASWTEIGGLFTLGKKNIQSPWLGSDSENSVGCLNGNKVYHIRPIEAWIIREEYLLKSK